MAKNTLDNIKLGIFVLAGLVLLILALYMVGKDTNLFSKNYTLRVQFQNISGLLVGNNIRYAGIQVGTVSEIKLMNDTTVEITMLIEDKMKQFIHKKDEVTIGTDGLVGNKLLNITPGDERVLLAKEGDILTAKKSVSTDDMMEVLNKTNKNIAVISEELKSTVQRLNNSTAFWKILNDNTLPENIKTAMLNIRKASEKANDMAIKADNMALELQTVAQDIHAGKGSIGGLLKDTILLVQLHEAVEKIKRVGDNANNLATELNTLTQNVKTDINSGKGPVNALLKDSSIVLKMNKALENVEAGTANFNQNMEALKHNFFFKSYFKKQEKQKMKEEAAKGKNN
jgi:phospholipid/cholesterol/gamma-HCH transport system substrate-binding protein